MKLFEKVRISAQLHPGQFASRRMTTFAGTQADFSILGTHYSVL